ncbi:MAG: glutaredoxin family protein [Microbacterium pygmaeum]
MSRVTSRISLTLIGKPDCHLCDVAHDIVERVLADLPESVADRVDVTETSILDDPALYELWWEKIPVVLIDDELHAHWRVSSEALRGAILTASDRVAVRS